MYIPILPRGFRRFRRCEVIIEMRLNSCDNGGTVYPKKYAHGFVVLCFVVVMQSFIMNSHEVFIHIHQGCFAGTVAIVILPQCQWSNPDGYGEISQCITTTEHSKAKTVCIFLGIYCTCKWIYRIIFVHEWRTAYALTRVLFWFLFPELRRKSGNKCQNNTRVST